MIIQKMIIGKVLELATKQLTKKFKMKKVLDYVEKPNDADERIDKIEIDVFHHHKRLDKLEKESHEPIFTKKQYQDIIKRLKNLEKRSK